MTASKDKTYEWVRIDNSKAVRELFAEAATSKELRKSLQFILSKGHRIYSQPKTFRERHPLKVSRTRKLPRVLSDFVERFELLNISSHDDRLRIFIGWCKKSRYSRNTAMTYLSRMRSAGIIDPDKSERVRIEPETFTDNTSREQSRVITVDSFKKLVSLIMHERPITRYTVPFVIAILTALRPSEIHRFTTVTLDELRREKKIVSIYLKQTVVNEEKPNYWRPVYTEQLRQLVTLLCDNIYAEEYHLLYIQRKIETPLVTESLNTLRRRLRMLYYEANGTPPPSGFGIHTIRKMMASLLNQKSKNPMNVMQLLNHRSERQIKTYVKELNILSSRETFDTLMFLRQFDIDCVKKNIK